MISGTLQYTTSRKSQTASEPELFPVCGRSTAAVLFEQTRKIKLVVKSAFMRDLAKRPRRISQQLHGAVQAAFDTDCNGATVGSVVGMLAGAGGIPDKWISPFGGRLKTAIAGYGEVTAEGLAEKTAEIISN